MRLRNIPGAKEFVSAHPLVFAEKAALACAGKWRQVFAQDGPIHLEVGMGRGKFILNSALAEPEINFLALEIREEMVFNTIERMETMEIQPKNLRFLWLNAELLPEIFAPGEVERIYLNFPDPWPKSRHAKRRLTSQTFLERYHKILAPQGLLRFKTDNLPLFQWSLGNFRAAGWNLQDVDLDLPEEKSGVITEYESRYRRKGQPIYFLQASKE